MNLLCLKLSLLTINFTKQAQASYGKGPGYFRLKTAVFPVSMFLLLFRMQFGTEVENYQYDSSK